MGVETMGVIMLFGILALLMYIRVPIAFSLGIASVVTALFLDINLFLIFQKMVVSLNNFGFLAVPFFILSATIMTEGGISDKLMKFADVSSIGALLIPAMEKDGYDKDYSVAVTVTSSVQGIIIPPSQNMIYYAIAAGGLSISKLFIAGYIPGFLLGVSLMAVAYFIAVKRDYPVGDRYTFKEGLRISIDSILGLMTIVIIIGGIVGGIFTPTESAGISAVYGLIITTFVYKTMTFEKLKRVFTGSLSSLATIMAVISMSSMFGYILSYLQVPSMISKAMLSITDNPILIMIMVNVLLLVAGMFMNMAVLIFMLTPILLPVVTQIGYDPIHFGIIMILNLGLGLCTPPVGNSLFVGCAIADLPIEKSIKAFLPFYGVMALLLIVLIVFPQLTLWLPSVVIK